MLTTVTHNKKTGVSSGGNPEDLEASALIRPAGRDLGDKERVSFKPIGDRWKVLGFFLIWAVVLFFVMGRRPSDAERRVSPAIQDAEEILDNRESPVDVVESDSEGEEEGAEDREGDNREAPNRVKGTVIKYDHSTIAKISDTEAKDALRRLGALFIDTPARSELDLKRCQITTVGEGWGRHTLCGDLIKKDPSGQCLVISFGINKDYSFDVDAQKRTGCEVVSMDPTVSHPAQLAPHVRFFKWAAPGLSKNPRWTVVPLTSVATKVNMQQARIPILKMDCEGCEYRIFEDVAAAAFEIHVSGSWISTSEHALNYGRLVALMERSGLRAMHGHMGACGMNDDLRGCHEILTEVGYPCSRHRMCQNLLFARA